MAKKKKKKAVKGAKKKQRATGGNGPTFKEQAQSMRERKERDKADGF